MSSVLGIDLGVASIGWALVRLMDEEGDIVDAGVRIIPLDTDEKEEFQKGKQIEKNRQRTVKRTQRKGYDRSQMRRKALYNVLKNSNMCPDAALYNLPTLPMWALRARAVQEQVSLPELGKVFLHLNQRRGYKSSRSDNTGDKKVTEYLGKIAQLHHLIEERGITVGQYFYGELVQNPHFRIKQLIFKREDYIAEFDRIVEVQRAYYPTLLTEEWVNRVRDEIIYFQRGLKSQKGLVSVCEFEGKYYPHKDNPEKRVFDGPKVAPKSSPLAQLCKIWEGVNNIKVSHKDGRNDYMPTLDEKQQLVAWLDNNELLTETQVLNMLGKPKKEGWQCAVNVVKGLKGNTTKVALKNILGSESPWLRFDLTTDIFPNEETHLFDRKSGEVTQTMAVHRIHPSLEQQPLYQLWHTIYSLPEDQCAHTLEHKFGLPADVARQLTFLDFKKAAFSNKSAKALRKLLPYLMMGYNYSDAAMWAGYNHSNSLTNAERDIRPLEARLEILAKNSLRQPVVEKVLNQLIHLVNDIITTYGHPDEIRIELARELKQSLEEREQAFTGNNKREKEHEQITKRIETDYRHLGIRATHKNILKYKLFEQSAFVDDASSDNRKVATCIYCGNPFGLVEALEGNSVDVDHIIPRSLFFDNSQQNVVLVHRHCNKSKDNQTAYKYMSGQGTDMFNSYVQRVHDLYAKKMISKTKRDRLLTPQDQIPQDFLNRQLRQTQYIARKATEILSKICRKVTTTSGSVTAYLRNIWGWNEVLPSLQHERYDELGLTPEYVQALVTARAEKTKNKTTDDDKRSDHRHHAIDALVIACTKQGFIQRINELSASKTQDEMFKIVATKGQHLRGNLTLLEKYLILQRPFNTETVKQTAANILVSLKAGKKVTTPGKRRIKKGRQTLVVQTGIQVPRASLHEENIYGQVQTLQKNQPLKYLFEHPETILKHYIQQLVYERLQLHNNDPKAALKSTKKQPIILPNTDNQPLTYASCLQKVYVFRYPIASFKAKDTQYILDGHIQKLMRERLAQHNDDPKKAFEQPLYADAKQQIPIHTIRCDAKLSAVEPLRYNSDGQPISFVKPGNNHHVAIYQNPIHGTFHEHVCTLWHAVQRKLAHLPVVVKTPLPVHDQAAQLHPQLLPKLPDPQWTYLFSMQQNQMFILGLSNEQFHLALQTKNYRLLCKHLYRVQQLATLNYVFRLHTDTGAEAPDDLNKKTRKIVQVSSMDGLFRQNPIQVVVSRMGKIKPHTHHD